jgi:8-oxo-dGTP pyrophosphatase MutT (NUDIX family)
LKQFGDSLRYVFYGGKIHVEKGESPEDGFIRELEEESGLVADKSSIEKMAIIHMEKHLPNGAVKFLRLHVFLARKTTGQLRPSDEMEGWRWCNQRALPTHSMLVADPHWMPMIFQGKKVVVRAIVDRTQQHLLKPIHIQEVKNFSEDLLTFDECPSHT